MRLLRTTLIIFFFIACCVACNKDRFDTRVGRFSNGHVYAKYSEEPLLGAEVYLYLVTYTGWTSPDQSAFVGSTLTDDKGYFEFTHEEPEPLSYYVLEAHKNGYFRERKGAGKNLELYLEPEAPLRIYIKNINPFNEEDRIAFNSPCGASALIGTEIDTTLFCVAFYEQSSPMAYAVTKNGITTEVIDSIYPIVGDNITEYELLY